MNFLNFYFLSSFFLTPSFIRRATSGTVESSDFPEHGLVHDGTPCGENLVCVNQTCVSLFPHIDNTKCPTNQNNVECSGHGVSFQFFRFSSSSSSLSICVFISFHMLVIKFIHMYIHTCYMTYDTIYMHVVISISHFPSFNNIIMMRLLLYSITVSQPFHFIESHPSRATIELFIRFDWLTIFF